MPFFGGSGQYVIVGTNIKGGTDAAPSVTGSNNMALGNGAGQNLTSAESNIFIGNNAGIANTTQDYSLIIGTHDSAGAANLTVNNSLLFGDYVGDYFGGAATVSNSLVMSNNPNNTNSGAGTFTISNSVMFALPFNSTTFYSDFTLTSSIFIGRMLNYDPGYSANLTNSVVLGTGIVSLGVTDSIFIGNDIDTSAAAVTNAIAIGVASLPADNTITIGSVSHTSVIIGGVTFSSAIGANFPNGAIIGDPGTEGAGINVNGVTYNSTFKVSDIDGTNFAQTILHRHSTTLEPLIVGARSNTNTNVHGVVTNGMGLFSTYAVGWTGANYKIFGQEQFAVDDTGTISDTSAPGKWTLSLTPNGTLAPVPVITARNNGAVSFSGNVGIGNGASPDIGFLLSSANLIGTSQYGLAFQPTFTSTATVEGSCVAGIPNTAASSTVHAEINIFKMFDANIGIGSTITNLYGLNITDLTGGINNYGINSEISSGANKWNIHVTGTAKNYFAGQVGIGIASPNAAAALEVSSITQGVLFPRMTTAQKTAMANVAGMVVFDTTLAKLCVNSGAGWQTITSV